MVWEGYWSRLCKCNDFNVYGLFGRDNLLYSPLMFKNFDSCPHCRAKGLPGTLWRLESETPVVNRAAGPPFHLVLFFGAPYVSSPPAGGPRQERLRAIGPGYHALCDCAYPPLPLCTP